MVTVQEATTIVLKNSLKKLSPEPVSITEAVGRILSEEIRADRDFPPFDRVSMDGIAINFDEWDRGRREFYVEETQAAGEDRKALRKEENAMEAMTGAMLPEGTDTVIRYEDIEIKENIARVLVKDIAKGQNIHFQGSDAKRNEVLLEPGRIISPAEVALFATVGLSHVDVLAYPKIAIISSGNELVEIEESPEPYQIRRSNTYAIHAALRQLNCSASLFHLPDNKDFQRDSLQTIVASHDVLILTGGISKGKYDYIPQVLEEIGIEKKVHQVSQRPGKPFWFGVSKKGKVVFALPGNPVSTFLCFNRYVKPWLLETLGLPIPAFKAVLGEDFTFEPALTYFLQVQVVNEMGRLVAYPKAGGGSGDFANLKEVDAFLELPIEKTVFKKGEVYPLIPFR
ncbi:molybdopterin molybdotransferase MoeA [Chryseosolibacter indicus]|uniref:Molybdopterin molybdenumtransferase n=1 Tax=Chryseosolibacter indicus TaxID=2782351 RepID=A0ABS5VQ38_9BACT|nr:molybdopterin molybdotransferase MoeA [Chryseosolibacter indicus]MBT1703518.1 molybdopterin molybdotransferase MoeA [Chryseosolibacter indicus]